MSANESNHVGEYSVIQCSPVYWRHFDAHIDSFDRASSSIPFKPPRLELESWTTRQTGSLVPRWALLETLRRLEES